MPTNKIFITKDGFPSVMSSTFKETYHSINGALSESKHVFINAGLKYVAAQKQNIRLLEVGMGTGLNAALSCEHASKENIFVDYIAIEPFPLESEIVEEFIKICNNIDTNLLAFFKQIHNVQFNQDVIFHPHFHFQKINHTFNNFKPKVSFDLVYYDAFSPAVQPEMWTYQVFEKLYECMQDNACMVTYCAKGIVKRYLRSIGFQVQTLKGANEKREMIRAIKKQHI